MTIIITSHKKEREFCQRLTRFNQRIRIRDANDMCYVVTG